MARPQHGGREGNGGYVLASAPQTLSADDARAILASPTDNWSSPPFSQIARTSFGSLPPSSLDPFAEEDGYVVGKGRKRTKFGRSSSEWTYVNTPPSPADDAGTWDDSEDLSVGYDEGGESTVISTQIDTVPSSQVEMSMEQALRERNRTEPVDSNTSTLQPANVDGSVSSPPSEVEAADFVDPTISTYPQPPQGVVHTHSDVEQNDVEAQIVGSPLFSDTKSVGHQAPLGPRQQFTEPSRFYHLPFSGTPLSSPVRTPSPSIPDGLSKSRGSQSHRSNGHNIVNNVEMSVVTEPDPSQSFQQDIENPETTATERVSTSHEISIQSIGAADTIRTHASTPPKIYESRAISEFQAGLIVQPEWRYLTASERSEREPTEQVNASEDENGHGGALFVEMQDGTSISSPDTKTKDDESHMMHRIDGEADYEETQPVSQLSQEEASEEESLQSLDAESESDRSLDRRLLTQKLPRSEIVLLDSDDENQSDVPVSDQRPEPRACSEVASQFSEHNIDILQSGTDQSCKAEPPAIPAVMDNVGEAIQNTGMRYGVEGEVRIEGAWTSVAATKQNQQRHAPGPSSQDNHHRDGSGSGCYLDSEAQRSVEGIIGPEVYRLNSDAPALPRSGNNRDSDAGLFLDGASSEASVPQQGALRIRASWHSNDQLLTPNGTQEPTLFASPRFPYPSRAVHTLPTPQTSQEVGETALQVDSQLVEIPEHSTASIVIPTNMPDSLRYGRITRYLEASSFTPNEMNTTRSTEISKFPNNFQETVHSGERHVITESTDVMKATEDQSIRETVETHACGPELPPALNVTGFRTRLSYFPPLSTLSEYFNQSVDVMSIVSDVSEPLRATRGHRGYFTTLHLTDPSSAGVAISAQVFRKHKDALPVARKGDVVLLLNFSVQSADHGMTLQSKENSSWAVFVQGESDDVQVNGPPTEFDAEERGYVSSLRKWYEEVGADMIARRRLPTTEDRRSTETYSTGSSESSSVGSRGRANIFKKFRRPGRSARRRITIHTLRDGKHYTEIGSPSDKDSIHELRDGTVYANPC